MSRNILIFSDGTGQAGGLTPDENVSNIYKLYRATRCGPDSDINPSEQLTFYDPGLGSEPENGVFGVERAYRWAYNLVSQATGLGITLNIVDCYAAILQMWQPGDHIFLFGFSRGAYIVRCVAAVLSLCGVPTTMADGKTPLFRDTGSARKIAKEAVKKVYQHVSSPRDTAYVEQRKALALQFRHKYGSDANGAANVNPFFIGVFDTVAALGSYWLFRALLVGVVALLALFSYAQSFLFALPFLTVFGWSLVAALVIAGTWYAITHVQFAVGLPGYSFFQTLHFTAPKMQFYDKHLDNAVWYARHAMSIDENRADFARVQWGSTKNQGPPRPDSYPDWLNQIWFAGVHSDIGGGYAENESRLSDIALEWMVRAAEHLPDEATPNGNGITVDRRFLKLIPDARGPQHDAREPGYLCGLVKWTKGLRPIDRDAKLHPSVYDRFVAGNVQHFYEMKPYRPENLRDHVNVTQYY
ncbi:MAG: DUF2235 domain-containing protein [Xanthobacteraceae bacterium]|nr:DUF2235 domain-containing protein [Xanthobacteraceae bacterium]